MRKIRLMGGGLAVAMAVSAIVAPAASANGRPLRAELAAPGVVPAPAAASTAAVAPAPADATASGVVRLRLNQGQRRICYAMSLEGVTNPTGVAIHAGSAGEAGGAVVTLWPSEGNSAWQGCVRDMDRELIRAIRQHASSYDVQVEDADHPEGVLRGQLSRFAPPGR